MSGQCHQREDGGAPIGRLTAAAGLNVGFAVVQVLVGLAIGSVVVLADAAHQVVDALGLLTALIAAVLARRPAGDVMSFGWGKADALGGLVSALLLLGSIVWISYESIVRLLRPVEVDGGGVIAIGLAAVVVNAIGVLAVSGGHGHEHLSMRAARLHLLIDLGGSFLVVAAGLVLTGTSWTWIDPAASLLLSLVVLRATWGVLRSAADELLDRAPAEISVSDVTSTLARQPGVERVHHVHVRPLGRQRTSATAHVVVPGHQTLHEAQNQVDALGRLLLDKHGIAHATIQLECHPCENDTC